MLSATGMFLRYAKIMDINNVRERHRDTTYKRIFRDSVIRPRENL